MQHQGEPPAEPPYPDHDGTDSQPTRSGDSTQRFTFTAPDGEPQIEFKKVRRPLAPGEKAPRRHLRIRLRRRHVVVAAAAVVVLLLGSTVWVGARGWLAAAHLKRAATLFTQLQQQIEHADTAAASVTLAALQRETADAHGDTADFLWAASTLTPGVGDDLDAVRTVAAALDDLTHNGLGPLIDVAGNLTHSVLSPKAGRIDLSGLDGVAPRLSAAYASVARAKRSVDGIATDHLVAQLRGAVNQLDDGLDRAQQMIVTAYRAALLLPPMLGAKGPRTYLVMFQNSAEARATGGMPGEYIVVTADEGAVRIIDQGHTSSAIKPFPKPVLPLTDEQLGLYTERLGVFPADVNLTPDFPTAAKLYREMYRQRSGRTVDGVFSADPVALSYVLRATGTITMPIGAPLTASTAVRLLLQQSYATLPSIAQKEAYFAAAARATFQALASLHADPRTLMAELARAAGERRLLAWSAHPEEEQALAGTVLAGQLPADDGTSPTVGVFLNDASGSKLSYYLTHSASLSMTGCDDGGGRELALHLTLGSTVPPRGLPAYVLGLGLSGHPYVVRTNVMVFSPTGGSVVSATSNGADVDMATGTEGNRQVAMFTVDLAPGAAQTLDLTLLTGSISPAAATTPQLWTTPGVSPWRVTVPPALACAK